MLGTGFAWSYLAGQELHRPMTEMLQSLLSQDAIGKAIQENYFSPIDIAVFAIAAFQGYTFAERGVARTQQAQARQAAAANVWQDPPVGQPPVA